MKKLDRHSTGVIKFRVDFNLKRKKRKKKKVTVVELTNNLRQTEAVQAVRILAMWCGQWAWMIERITSKLWARAAPCFRFSPFFKLNRWIFVPFLDFFFFHWCWLFFPFRPLLFLIFVRCFILVRHETEILLVVVVWLRNDLISTITLEKSVTIWW